MDSLFDLEAMIKKRSDYEKYQQTQSYVQEINRLNKIISDCNSTLVLCGIAATRDNSFSRNSILLWGLQDIIDSLESIRHSSEEGFLHPAKRELRYVLETLIKYLYTDQNCIEHKLEDRFAYFHNSVSNSGIEELNHVKGINKDLKSDIKQIYKELCAYVHPSKKQISEYLRRERRESSLSFESHTEYSSFNKMLFRCLDIFLYLMFLGIGMPTTGDVFINAIDQQHKWSFKNGKHTKIMSSFFDSKLERKKSDLPK